MKKFFMIALATMILTGCYTPPNIYEMSESQMAYMHRYSKDEFDSAVKLVGMDVGEMHNQGIGAYSSRRFIRSFFYDDGSETHQIYLSVSYTGGWWFYRAAVLPGGEHLKFTAIDREVIGCPYQYLGCNHSESMVAEITGEQLESAAVSGLRVNFQTRFSNISTTIEFPATYISSYLEKVLEIKSLPPGNPYMRREPTAMEVYEPHSKE